MQITIDIPENLVAVAMQQGVSPEHYAEQLLRGQGERMHLVERFLREFPITGLPVLPESAYDRESIYSDDR